MTSSAGGYWDRGIVPQLFFLSRDKETALTVANVAEIKSSSVGGRASDDRVCVAWPQLATRQHDNSLPFSSNIILIDRGQGIRTWILGVGFDCRCCPILD